MGLSKNITLTIKDYEIRLDKQIKFYENDTIDLCFSILEYGIEVKDGISINKLMPIQALRSYMLIETPQGIDYAEATKIKDNKIVFNLGAKYSQFVGIGHMQIVVKDSDGCRVTLPEFEFEIKKSINTDWDKDSIFLATEDDSIIIDEFGREIHMSKISDMPISENLSEESYVMIIDEEGNKRLKVKAIANAVEDSLDAKFNAYTDEISGGIEEFKDNVVERIEGEMNEISEALDDIETQKATKSDLDIQKKRIDSFISLKEGSTTGDAELIDGRIGNNGIIYNSIGNAIREQIHTINNALNTKIGLGEDLNIPISSISMGVGRIQCTTGDIAHNITDFSYITLDVNGYKSIEIDTSHLGANDLGYAFYDSSNTYISGSRTTNAKLNISIPDNAYFFRYGDRNTTWQTRISENKSIILINKDERSYKTLNERLINLEKYNEKQNKEYGINPNEIGVMDNKFPYVWYGVGNVYSMTSKYSKPTDSRASFVISTDFDGQSGMIRNNGTAYFTINKGAEVKYYKLRKQNGAECTFDSTVESGKVLYQNNTNNKMGEVIYSDEEKFVVFIESYSIPMTFSCYSDTNRTIESPFDINLNKSAIFYKEYPKSQINFDYKYLSRAEKLGSKIIGKNLFVFSDSQSSVIKPLAQDFGANVFSISNGGCRMGYVTGSGLGGESGSANSLWLCNKERTDQFNDFIYNNNINIDYIINFTGGNGDFDNIGNAEELSYVLNNKRWFGDRSDNDKFDNLSDENKLRFTSPLCYIASFITLNKLFPKAISVCVDLYGSVGNTLGSGKFENGVWKNNNDVANAIYNHDVRTLNKSRLIREISELIGAILVKASECGLNVINCPTYASDSVHANFKMATNLAYNIHKKIDFFNSIEEDYK